MWHLFHQDMHFFGIIVGAHYHRCKLELELPLIIKDDTFCAFYASGSASIGKIIFHNKK